jgi:mRNA-degrading endonuclease RelE of RelBE toxin-antitoxin system
VRVHIGSAAQAQLSTMPESDQRQVAVVLQKLGDEFPNTPDLRKIAATENLWETRVTPELRLLVQIRKGRAIVVAFGRRDQLQHYFARRER